MNKPICIYHRRATTQCADGFGSAWIMNKYFKTLTLGIDCEFHAAIYNEPPPDVTDRLVYLVDFSYPQEVVRKMLETARFVTIIDHHKSALDDLQPLVGLPKFELVGNTEFSGAMLVWRYCFPEEPAPALIRHIEDQDLNRFSLIGTHEIVSAIYSYPFEFAVWDAFDLDTLVTEGAAILRSRRQVVKGIIEQPHRRINIAGHNVLLVNCGSDVTSAVGHELGEGEKFTATYVDTSEHRVFSLRSPPDGLDVSVIAKQYGGGGHKHAAGFRIPLVDIERNLDQVFYAGGPI